MHRETGSDMDQLIREHGDPFPMVDSIGRCASEAYDACPFVDFIPLEPNLCPLCQELLRRPPGPEAPPADDAGTS
eukprot:9488900-Pyramimonas_sp.AAC.1